MLNYEQQQCHLGALGFYKLRRKDGTLAVDGTSGPATRNAIYNFQIAHRKRPDGTVLDTDGLWGPNTEKALREVIGTAEPPQSPPVKPPTPGMPAWWSKYPHIKREWWRCRCGGRFCNGFPLEPHEATVAMLEKYAVHFNTEIVPHSGIRCDRYNATIPGASPYSKHRLAMAFDFHMAGVSPEQLRDYFEVISPNAGGCGIYTWGIHIDDRPVRGRWDSR